MKGARLGRNSQPHAFELNVETSDSSPSPKDALKTTELPKRFLSYEWRGSNWKLKELLEFVKSDFDSAEVYKEAVFQRRLREQLAQTGEIDPYLAAIKRDNPVQGGISYRVDHHSGPESSAYIIKSYVGITQADANTRLARHFTQAKRPRGPRSRDDSLPAAIRREIRKGTEPSDVFRISVLEQAETNEELVAQEEKWIRTIDTMTPSGYNIHPPGSLGGPSNSKPIEFKDAGVVRVAQNFTEVWQYFRGEYGEDRVPSLGSARWRYYQFLEGQTVEEKEGGRKEIKDARRLTIQWVFGVDGTIPDGRWGDTPCTVNGVFYSSLGAAAQATNEKYASLKSLYHRRLKEIHRSAREPDKPIEIGIRKKPGFRAASLPLPDPRDPESGSVVSASEFQRMTGANKTSVNNRWQALNEQPWRLRELTGKQIVDILKNGEAPKPKILKVLLPDGTDFLGTVASFAKAFSVGGSHAAYCAEPFSYSGIKRRFGTLPLSYTNTDLLLVLGVLLPAMPSPEPSLAKRKTR